MKRTKMIRFATNKSLSWSLISTQYINSPKTSSVGICFDSKTMSLTYIVHVGN